MVSIGSSKGFSTSIWLLMSHSYPRTRFWNVVLIYAFSLRECRRHSLSDSKSHFLQFLNVTSSPQLILISPNITQSFPNASSIFASFASFCINIKILFPTPSVFHYIILRTPTVDYNVCIVFIYYLMNFIYDNPSLSVINFSNVLPWVSCSTGELNNNRNHKSSVLKL